MGVSVLSSPGGQALRILLWQVAGVLAASAASAFVWGGPAGAGVLVGGGIAALPTVYIALKLYTSSLDRGAPVGAHSLLVGWAIKNAVTIGLLIVAFRSRAFPAPALLGGLAAGMVAYWLCMALGSVKHANGGKCDGE